MIFVELFLAIAATLAEPDEEPRIVLDTSIKVISNGDRRCRQYDVCIRVNSHFACTPPGRCE